MSKPLTVDPIPGVYQPVLEVVAVGSFLNYALLGILFVQVYFYWVSFKKDSTFLRALVFFITFLDVLQIIFASHQAWTLLITKWGDLSRFESIWSTGTLTPLSGLTAFSVQSFYAWRVWTLGSNSKVIKLLVVIIVCLTITSCVMSFTYGITIDKFFLQGRKIQITSFAGWIMACIICDALITGTLIVQLRRYRRPKPATINHVIHRAIRMTIETGALTLVIAMMTLAFFLSFNSRQVYFFAPIIISGKVYSNSLMASLNSRAPMFRIEDISDADVLEFNLSHLNAVLQQSNGGNATLSLNLNRVESHVDKRSVI